jgi:integrase/recombinase XerD
MKTLSHYLDDYLKLRRQLGYKMESVEFMLRNFVHFAQQEGAGVIRTKLALQWATQSKVKPGQSANRLGGGASVRRLCQRT